MKDSIEQELEPGDLIAILGGWRDDVGIVHSATPTGRIRYLTPVHKQGGWDARKTTTTPNAVVVKLNAERAQVLFRARRNYQGIGQEQLDRNEQELTRLLEMHENR